MNKEKRNEKNGNVMSSTWINENETEDVCAKVLNLVQATKSKDVSVDMAESKEKIFDMVNRKIVKGSETVRAKMYRRNLRLVCSAAACLALIFAVAGYRLGLKNEVETVAPSIVEIDVPCGVMSKISLSDGTAVTLNGGSKLSYSAPFDKTRAVNLSGEGFFEVAKKDGNPFFVNAQNVSVKVLGTRFAVKTYADDSQTVVTLEEGSVEAIPVNEGLKRGSVMLEPNQQLVVDNRTGEFFRKNVSAQTFIAWKDGVLSFNNLTLGEIAVILERRFDVKIAIDTEKLVEERYNAQFRHRENLEEILDKLSYKRLWKFSNQAGVIVIQKK